MLKINKKYAKEIIEYLKSKESLVLSAESIIAIRRHWVLNLKGAKIRYPTTNEVEEILRALKSKKQTQRALKANKPAPATLSIPDDACHYHNSLQRTLTVREMARIQSFPDWYQIKSKVTTGGDQRKFEVPQYTQIGNAVPPILGVALGQVCKNLLQFVD